jgi:hypothetical protein
MTNTFTIYSAQQTAEVALGLSKGQFRLASVVTHYDDSSFKEGRGDTVFLSVPGALTAHARALDDVTNTIVLDSLTESQEPVKLDVHAYSAVGLSEYDLSLGLVDFAKQVLMPQVDSVVAKIEATLERVIAGIAADPAITGYDPANPIALFTRGRAALREKGIDPASADLVAIVGSRVVDDLLDSGALDFSKTGAADALRSGSLGRIRGFETIESGSIGETEVIFMTRTALYLAHRAPAVPQGAAFGQTVSNEEISLRYLRDYDPSKTQERSLVSTFVGAGILPLYRVERTEDVKTKQGEAGFVAGSATVTEVPGGAVVKVDTTTA